MRNVLIKLRIIKIKEECLFKRKGGYIEDNNDLLWFKSELMVSSMEESKSLPEKENEKQGNHINPSSIKKNCVVKLKQVLVHLKNQYY